MSVVFGICVIAFIGIVLPFVATKLHREGYFIKKQIRPYYDEIYTITKPYLNTEFAKALLQKSEAALKELHKLYFDFLRQSSLRDDDVCKFVIEKNQDRDFVELFSLLFVFAFQYYTPVRPSEEDSNALQSLQQFAKKKLQICVDDIPECLLSYFETTPEQIKGKD